uniref:TadE/TadG family type IV pilus assembly protein n=1 Tax=Brucella pseudintermedia TaxID=370111 RepID=UPI0039A61346
MRNSIRNFLGDRRGLGAVEFALIAPLLLLIYLGSVDLRRSGYQQESVAFGERPCRSGCPPIVGHDE